MTDGEVTKALPNPTESTTTQPVGWICPQCGFLRYIGLVHSCLTTAGFIHRRMLSPEPFTIKIIGGRPHVSGKIGSAA